MTFGYPIHFHQQLHFSVRNANGKSVLSLTVLWRKQASNYDSVEFQLEMWAGSWSFPSLGRIEKEVLY